MNSLIKQNAPECLRSLDAVFFCETWRVFPRVLGGNSRKTGDLASEPRAVSTVLIMIYHDWVLAAATDVCFASIMISLSKVVVLVLDRYPKGLPV